MCDLPDDDYREIAHVDLSYRFVNSRCLMENRRYFDIWNELCMSKAEISNILDIVKQFLKQ